jgi:hypothetical protein
MLTIVSALRRRFRFSKKLGLETPLRESLSLSRRANTGGAKEALGLLHKAFKQRAAACTACCAFAHALENKVVAVGSGGVRRQRVPKARP